MQFYSLPRIHDYIYYVWSIICGSCSWIMAIYWSSLVWASSGCTLSRCSMQNSSAMNSKSCRTRSLNLQSNEAENITTPFNSLFSILALFSSSEKRRLCYRRVCPSVNQFSREPWDTQNQYFQHRSVYTSPGINPNLVRFWQLSSELHGKNHV